LPRHPREGPAGGQAARLSGAGARPGGEHDGRQGERRRDRAAGERDEGGAGEVPGAAREPRVTPFLLVLSSPSGGGKTTIARRLLASRSDIGYSVSATTRAMRPGEVNGRDYWFLSEDEFEAKVMAGEFLEHASYHGRRYGTLRSEVERHFAAGRHVVLDIEVNGARQVRRQMSGAVLVFVIPPTGAALVERLAARRTEDRAALEGRLAIAT